MSEAGEESGFSEEEPGACPQCGKPAKWLPVDHDRRGRICRACGWVCLPETEVVPHTVGSLLRRMFPRSSLIALIDYLRLVRASRKEQK